MKSIHDPTYYKKMWDRDTLAVAALHGRGKKSKKSFYVPSASKKSKKRKKKKTRSYIKSGAPFNLDPPKRRKATELSAPPGIGEGAGEDATNILLGALDRYVESLKKKFPDWQPLFTATPLPGVGFAKKFKGTDLEAIIDLDATGPGIGVGISPKTLAKMIKYVPHTGIQQYAKLIETAPGRVYIGVELHGLLPLPFIGGAVVPADKQKLEKWIKTVTSNKKEEKSQLEKWISLATREASGLKTSVEILVKTMEINIPPIVIEAYVKNMPVEIQQDLTVAALTLKLIADSLAIQGAKGAVNMVTSLGKRYEQFEGTAQQLKKSFMKDLERVKKEVLKSGTTLLIGDSQFGVGKLDDIIKKRFGRTSNIVSIVKSGFGPDAFLGLDVEKELKKKPANIIIALGGNDIRNAAALANSITHEAPESAVFWVGPPAASVITNFRLTKKRFGRDAQDNPRHMINITSSRKRRGEQLKQILRKYSNITYIDSHEILSNAGYVEEPGKNADGIHLTDKGAELIVNAILGKILPMAPRISFLEVTRVIKIDLSAKQKIMAGHGLISIKRLWRRRRHVVHRALEPYYKHRNNIKKRKKCDNGS